MSHRTDFCLSGEKAGEPNVGTRALLADILTRRAVPGNLCRNLNRKLYRLQCNNDRLRQSFRLSLRQS